MIVTGRNIGPELCKILGLDGKKVSSIVLRVAADEIVTVTAEMSVIDRQAGEILSVLKRYELVEKEEEE